MSTFVNSVRRLGLNSSCRLFKRGHQLLSSSSSSWVKHYSTEDPNNLNRRLPTLMNLPETPIPVFRHTLRNFFFTHFLVRPYFDTYYSTNNFTEGAKTAIEFVSNCLASGDFDSLENSSALSSECLKEIKRNISLFTKSQRQRLAIKRADILWDFIYQIGIMMEDLPEEDEETGHPKHTRHVEITYTAHIVRNLDNKVDPETVSIGEFKDFFKESMETGDHLVVNYRFIRDYTKGVEDSWTINALNHFYVPEAHTSS